ncbi:MAG: hypothetical protein JRN67_04215 [Nitrososphaerota archaeon]|nr:hypothetical protein [Nitrososphaerota archaeon]
MKVYVCPWDSQYLNDVLFTDQYDKPPRGGKWPWQAVKEEFVKRGIEISTIDKFDRESRNCAFVGVGKVFTRFPELEYYASLAKELNFHKRILLSTEPPCISPNMYFNIDRFLAIYTHVYYACKLDGTLFSNQRLKSVMHNKEVSRIRYFNSPVKMDSPLMPEFYSDLRSGIVMINTNKAPIFPYRQLYGARIAAINYFGKFRDFALYGRGWLRPTLYPRPLNYRSVRACYEGALPLEGKYDVLSKHNFALCFENCAIPGYITEKIFDCFCCGTIPIYLGAPDVSDFIPSNCFVDFRRFEGFAELRDYLSSLTKEDIQKFRDNIVAYFKSAKFAPFKGVSFACELANLVEN